ncbi:hypothetical protein CEXT_483111 [Caerostris extrusa]|uniref:Uncharacterized protein n=1 Tax=Caerostris extrusa TaxID=172846 RepID=A0AAV4UK81_CAEEX|nr:hypothetical protein CEXT_483111 [Caerostris extrusa]
MVEPSRFETWKSFVLFQTEPRKTHFPAQPHFLGSLLLLCHKNRRFRDFDLHLKSQFCVSASEERSCNADQANPAQSQIHNSGP